MLDLWGSEDMAFDTLTDDTQHAGDADELLAGTTLFHGQYRIKKFLNSGGFGITYLATDSLNRDVVLKECFADAFCHRHETRVMARSESSKPHVQSLMRSFLKEAHTLAALSHPNIVGVRQVFEDNGTAYMALDYIQGSDLTDIIDEGKVALTPGHIVEMTRKLVSALGYIHDRHILHCDISPDNICVNQAGDPVLIDFGAARKTANGSGQQQSGFSVVKDGYTPYELYTTGGNCGPWSDIYSLGASLYHAISGVVPVDCRSRLSAIVEQRPDPLVPLTGTLQGYPPGFLEGIDKAIAVQVKERHPTAQSWLNLLAPPDVVNVRKVLLFRRAGTPVAMAAK
jgi:serine/threonine protein kinase